MEKPTVIAVGSITNAMRGQQLLAGEGILTQMKRVSHLLPNRGCGYCLMVKTQPQRALALLKEAGIRILEVVTAP